LLFIENASAARFERKGRYIWQKAVHGRKDRNKERMNIKVLERRNVEKCGRR
jgi:hypothetical protein